MEDVNMQGNGQTPGYFDSCKKTNCTSNADKMRECFDRFDKDRDEYLNQEEFNEMVAELFVNKSQSYQLTEKQKLDLFKLLDENQDGKIDREEFKICWFHWLKQILDPVSAILVVDVQNDFITGTLSLSNCPAKQDGAAVIPVINEMLEKCAFDYVVYTLDWHPADHISFIENVHLRPFHHSCKLKADEVRELDVVSFEGPPVIEQCLWKGHCVEHSWGSELHKDLKVFEDGIFIRKGTNSNVDSYSAFWDNNKATQTELVSELTKRGVTDVYVCGLAYDVCVGATTQHSVEHGFRTVLIDDASRGVSLENIRSTKQRLQRQGAIIVQSDEVASMVACDDRRPELGYQAALNIAMARRLVKEEELKAK